MRYLFCATARCPAERVANASIATDSTPVNDISLAALQRNLIAMPTLLKLITLTGLGALIPVTTTLLPNFQAGIFGLFDLHISASEWWSSTGGKMVSVTAALFCASAVMLLGRSRYGRLFYIAASLLMCFSIPVVASVVGVRMIEWRLLLAVNLVWTVVSALYLHYNSEVKQYFGTAV